MIFGRDATSLKEKKVAFARRNCLRAIGLCTIGLAGIGVARGADFPSCPSRLVVAFPAGGASDVAARVIAAALGKRLGQSVFVENISGATGNIGADKVAKSAADGHTLLFGTLSMGINPSLFDKLPFNVLRDFAPVSLVSTSPYMLLANARSDICSFADLVRLAKASSEPFQYASAGNGSGAHLFMELVCSITGIKLMHVPYRGAAPAMNDVLSGQVPLVFDSILTAMPHVHSGKLRAFAVSTRSRSKIAPNIPTLQELGVRGYEATAWFGIFAPAGTPKPVVNQLNVEITEVLRQPDVTLRLAELGAEPVPSSPEALETYFRAEVTKWNSVIKLANVRMD